MSAPQRLVIGGLSCIFSSTTTKPCSASLPLSFSSGIEEKGLPSAIRGEEFSMKERALSSSPRKLLGTSRKEHSIPVSVLHGPVSCCRSDAYADGSVCLGFVSKASGNPSVDSYSYDLSSPMAIFSGMADPDELTFSMEYNCRELGNGDQGNHSVEEILVAAQARHRKFHEETMVKAFYQAEWAHREQVCSNGHPYMQHCVETAVLLAKAGATSTIVAAGLLHDTIDDSFSSYDHISRTFGAGVADLVEGDSKLSQLSQLVHESNTASKTVKADRLHTMVLAMADARAVLIKLADRLHDMMMLEALPVHKQQRFAKETLAIFVPLANRLRISTWKDQLENLCFKHLNPGFRWLSGQDGLPPGSVRTRTRTGGLCAI
ncbi:hypothetical protein MLD38_007867 [Melastoma candidum]|uniref:Uncharacterized protein n=1 Tax=Melastoma candidum TaxID=119954 RepID=A0ACB9RVI4_9MYRT|nr:hypothetical protein MLD38_007867 [Melastoma candidum]